MFSRVGTISAGKLMGIIVASSLKHRFKLRKRTILTYWKMLLGRSFVLCGKLVTFGRFHSCLFKPNRRFLQASLAKELCQWRSKDHHYEAHQIGANKSLHNIVVFSYHCYTIC